jgi:thiosulfate dehydrogenase [quinone] large subunit
MVSQKQFSHSETSSWVMLPLRLFLGVTFVYAGIQKFTDPQFLQPGTPGYIGKQLVAFASGSPLHTFLLQFAAPHALFFGFLVAYGEIAIGLGTLFGILLRPAAFFGILINCMFFLSATWRVYPFFYSSDIVFVFCWLTLLLNGPGNTGLPTFDEFLAIALVQYAQPQRQLARARSLSFLLGVPPFLTLPDATSTQTVKQRKILQRGTQARRSFLFGMLGGGTAMFAILGIIYTFSRRLEPASQPETTEPSTAASALVTPPTDATPTATPTSGGTSSAIAQISAIPRNSAVAFTLPSSGDPGVLIHTQGDKFVAFDAICTHSGCQVAYDPSIQLLACPCHGAEFDPDHQATPVQGPALTPLAPVAIHIDSATGAITLQ